MKIKIVMLLILIAAVPVSSRNACSTATITIINGDGCVERQTTTCCTSGGHIGCVRSSEIVYCP